MAFYVDMVVERRRQEVKRDAPIEGTTHLSDHPCGLVELVDFKDVVL